MLTVLIPRSSRNVALSVAISGASGVAGLLEPVTGCLSLLLVVLFTHFFGRSFGRLAAGFASLGIAGAAVGCQSPSSCLRLYRPFRRRNCRGLALCRAGLPAPPAAGLNGRIEGCVRRATPPTNPDTSKHQQSLSRPCVDRAAQWRHRIPESQPMRIHRHKRSTSLRLFPSRHPPGRPAGKRPILGRTQGRKRPGRA